MLGKATRLKDVKIKSISILIDDMEPANGKPVLVKSDNSVEIEAVVQKFDPEGFLVIRPMVSKDVDTDDEYYEDLDVMETAYATMKSIQEDGGMLFDINHDHDVQQDVFFTESKIIKEEDKTIWEMVLDIRENEMLMEKAKNSQINGVSIYGTAVRSKFRKFEDYIDKHFKEKKEISEIKKDFDSILEDRSNNDIWMPVNVLWDAIWDAEWDYLYEANDPAGFKKELKKVCNQFIKYVNNMTFEKIEKGANEMALTKDEIKGVVREELGLEENQTLDDLIKNALVEGLKDIKKSEEDPDPAEEQEEEPDNQEQEQSEEEPAEEVDPEIEALKKKNDELEKKLNDLADNLAKNRESGDDGEDNFEYQETDKEKQVRSFV